MNRSRGAVAKKKTSPAFAVPQAVNISGSLSTPTVPSPFQFNMTASVLEPNLVFLNPAASSSTSRKRKEPQSAQESSSIPSSFHTHDLLYQQPPPNKRSVPDSGFASLYSQCALVSDESLHNGSSQSSPLETASTSSASSGTILSASSTAIVPAKPQSNKSLKYVGAQITTTQGGPQRAVQLALEMGARALGLFVRSARRWTATPLSDDAVRKYKDKLIRSCIQADKVVCHGSYLINPGSPSPDVLNKSRVSMIDEMQRCERLGIKYYNIHPGSTCGRITVNECIERIVDSLNEVLSKTSDVTLLLETMCCQGYTVGGKLSELKEIMSRVHDKNRLGVCLDTCHVYSAGNDITKRDGWEKYLKEFDEQIGLDKLRAVHLNDSELPVGSHLDRHAPIGNGWIGREGFKLIMNDSRLNNLPMILETTDTAYRHEIDLLYSYCQD
ncbi:probable endonuclease 4 [Paramacrobiotus metropolitanus]|uniref:probable endonuclease 4 n=1 Tax=Paramacrobiotus metropolitanus TaxID=2943436 RepID=UPI0024462E3F|nr:probable endonuclease 4 [Paramacrobiotus metropolitanus]